MFFFAFSAAKFPVPKIYYGKPTMYIMRQIEDSGQYVICGIGITVIEICGIIVCRTLRCIAVHVLNITM